MAQTHSGKKKSTVAGLVIAALIGGYTMFRPAINQATGWNLPSISEKPAISDKQAGSDRNEAVAQRTESSSSSTKIKTPEVFATSETASQPAKSTKPSGSKTAEKLDSAQPGSSKSGSSNPTSTKPGPLASRMSPSKSASSPSAPGTDSKTANAATSETQVRGDPSLKYGLLREIGPDRYMSPEGLLYTPGSAEGHRLEHLKRHTIDQPTRPGKHGVFDGGMEGALQSIERAYERAKAGQRTSKQVDGNRTIYTVDMGKRVGFVGGREGNQKRKPLARRIRMVLEGNRVITAFPM